MKSHLKKAALVGAGLLVALTGYRLNMYLSPVEIIKEERNIKVSAITVEPSPLTSWTFAEGTVQAQRKAFLDFEHPGKVVAIGADSQNLELREGSRVTKEQRLASLDSRSSTANVDSLTARLTAARLRSEEAAARNIQAKNDLQLARLAYKRTSKLHKNGLISRDALDRDRTAMLNAEAALTAANSFAASANADIQSISAEREGALIALSKDSLFAPFDGLLTVMNLREGNYYYPPVGITSNSAREAASAIVVVDDSQFEITLDIPEREARSVKEGQSVIISADSGRLYESAQSGVDAKGVTRGTVWSVSPALSLQNRSRRVKVRTAAQQPTILQDGLFSQVWIATQSKNNALTLPIESLSFRDRKPYIYVINADNTVTLRNITAGLQGLTRIEITSGLQAGDRVVTRGQHLLDNKVSVTIINENTSGQETTQ